MPFFVPLSGHILFSMQVFSLQDALRNPQAVTQLHLDRSDLKTVPVEVLQCIHLKQLNLNENQLTGLPDWLPQLTELKKLTLRGNHLQKWSADWSAWSSLKTLDLSQNQLTSVRGARLPDSLEDLDLSHNRLRTLSLHKLPTSLVRLRLEHNSLKQLPNLRGCLKLRQLNVRKNLLSEWPTLPVATGPLAGLQSLSLAYNRLGEIPASIEGCRALRQLDLSGNQLLVLPAEMKHLRWLVSLFLGQNRLTRMPPVVAQLSILDQLFLAGNNLKGNIDLSANSQLRRLDLSKNPLVRIIDLPASLRHLSLKGIVLKDWAFLRKLPQLESLELPTAASEDLLQAVCHLSSLFVLRGLLPFGKKEKLLRLLKEPFSPQEKRALLDFWVFGAIKNMDRLLLQKALRSEISALSHQARLHLLIDTNEQDIPGDTQAICLYGRLQTSDAQLSSLFAVKAIQKSTAAKVAILGRAPYPDFAPDQACEWYSEAQLVAFLRKHNTTPPSWTDKALLRVKKRLLHPNPRQVKLALLLLEREVVPAELIPALILAGKVQAESSLKRKLVAVARQHCPPAYEALLQTPLQVKKPSNNKTAIRNWAEKARLRVDELEDLLGLL